MSAHSTETMKTRRLLWIALGILGLIVIVVQSRTIWLPWIAQNLVVEDTLAPSDVITVFAAKEARGRHAAHLYRRDLAPRVLTTGELVSETAYLICGKRVTGAGFMAEILADEGVPSGAVVAIPHGTSTYEEAQAIKIFMTSRGYRSLIAVSSPYHMRRVRATLSHILEGTGILIQYSPARNDDFNVLEWWHHERDLIDVTNEYIKLVYYHLALFQKSLLEYFLGSFRPIGLAY
jgi:uncharacterized SAM-binding protein YcdF (DUF218 family)